MNLYDYLIPLEKQVNNQDDFKKKLSNNQIVALKGKKNTVIVGEGLGLKVNTSIGLNSKNELNSELDKINAINNLLIKPDIMMDLSTIKIKNPLYEIIANKIGCPVGTIPYYTCFNSKYGIEKNELLETINEQIEGGISFFTLHVTASLIIAERALTRKVPIISRGGSLVLRDMKINNRTENILLICLDDIIKICKKNNVIINIGSTFRPSTLDDALDNVNLDELKIQKKICKYIIDRGVNVQMEGIGHIPLLKIPKYVEILRRDMYVPFMPLGPIISDKTHGYDHITAAIGATYMAMLDGADIINAVTREEHTGGIPSINSIIEAIYTATTVVNIVNEKRFQVSDEKKHLNCMLKSSQIGCSRCGDECPFIWNDEYYNFFEK